MSEEKINRLSSKAVCHFSNLLTLATIPLRSRHALSWREGFVIVGHVCSVNAVFWGRISVGRGADGLRSSEIFRGAGQGKLQTTAMLIHRISDTHDFHLI